MSRPPLTDRERRQHAEDASQRGVSIVSQEIGYTPQTVRKWMDRFGITPAQATDPQAAKLPAEAMTAAVAEDMNTRRKDGNEWSDDADDEIRDSVWRIVENARFFEDDWLDVSAAGWDVGKVELIHEMFWRFRGSRLYDEGLDFYMQDMGFALVDLIETSRPYALAAQLAEHSDANVRELSGLVLDVDMNASMEHSIGTIEDHAANLNSFMTIGLLMELEAQDLTDISCSEAEEFAKQYISQARISVEERTAAGLTDAPIELPTSNAESSPQIENWLRSPHESLRRRAVMHPMATKSQVMRALDDPIFSVQEAAASMSHVLTSEDIEELYRDDSRRILQAPLLSNENASASLQIEAAGTDRDHLCTALLSNPNVTLAALKIMAENKSNGWRRSQVASHPKLSPELLYDLLRDDNPHVRAGAAANPNLSTKELDLALSDDHEEVVQSALAHPAVSHHQITEVLRSPDPVIRGVAAQSRQCTPEHLAMALKDEDDMPQINAVCHPNITTDQLRQAVDDKALCSDARNEARMHLALRLRAESNVKKPKSGE